MSYNEELQRNNDAMRRILDEVNALPDGTGGVQADYAQSDPAARDFIKHRPFYDDEKWRIAHEVRQFVSTEYGFDWIIGSDNIFDNVPIGTKCRIVVDGATYNGTMAAEPEDTGYYSRYIGNGHLENSDLPDTGEPFVFFATGLDCATMIPCDTMPSAATISVLESGEMVPIDPKFLPDPVQADWNQNDPAAPDFVQNRTHYEAVTIEDPVTVSVIWPGNHDADTVETIYALRKSAKYEISGADGTLTEYSYVEDLSSPNAYLFRVGNGIDTYRVKQNTTGFCFTSEDGMRSPSGYITYQKKSVFIHKLDPKFLPEISGASGPPYVIDAEAYTYGDDALAAILAGRQIYVKVPSQNPGGLYANFMPVIQYQLPQSGNDYLTLIYLKDGIAQNIMAALQTGSFDAVYGQIVMLLSQSYDDCPLKVSPIK